jgi:hypothetical protein
MKRESLRKSVTRRGLMQAMGAGAAGLATSAALPFRAIGAGAPVISPVTTKLATYMSEARERALPPEVVEQAKYHILDTFAAMISGADLPPGRVALKFAAAHRG